MQNYKININNQQHTTKSNMPLQTTQHKTPNTKIKKTEKSKPQIKIVKPELNIQNTNFLTSKHQHRNTKYKFKINITIYSTFK